MAKIITQKIVGFEVRARQDEPVPAPTPAPVIEQMHERLKRPEVLEGKTYKITPADSPHSLYVTINNAVLNIDTEHEVRVPFEIFINSKNMDDFQWVVALTRVISANFRKGGDCTFLVEELKGVFDPKGGYFKGGAFIPSLVAEIGTILETHLVGMGLMGDSLDQHQKAFLKEKRAQYMEQESAAKDAEQAPAAKNTDNSDSASGEYPPGATLCGACQEKAKVIMDGCAVCLACSDSKCS